MAKSPEEMTATMIANLAEKTGKPLEAWLEIARVSKAAKHGELVKLLKEQHGMTHGYANLVAHCAFRAPAGAAPEGDDLVAAQYTGAKEALRPIYEAILDIVRKFGGDVEVAPKKTYVSLRRSKQFALIQPSTAARIDLGINLKDTPAAGRLETSGSFNAMVSHRIRISALSEVDGELRDWLHQAYEAA